MGDDEGKRSARREYTSYCGGGMGEHRRNRSSANKGGRRRRPAITSRRESQVYCGGDGVAVGRGGGGGNDAHTGLCRRRHRALDGAASRRPNEAAAVIPRRPGSAHDPKAPVCVLSVSITEPCTHRSANCTLCDCRPDRLRVYVVIKLKIIILSRVSHSFRIVFPRDLLRFRENREGKIENNKKNIV